MLDHNPWELDSSFHVSTAQIARKQNVPFNKRSVSLLNTWISCNHCQQKVMTSGNLGNEILCVVLTLIFTDFIPWGNCRKQTQGRQDHAYPMPEYHIAICHLYCVRSTVPCLECNGPFQGRKASASQNSPFHFFQKMFSVLAGLLHVPPPAFQKKRWETDIICTEQKAFNEQ